MWDIIQECCESCILSYKQPSELNNLNFKYFSEKDYDGQCYIIYKDNKIIIVFRGSSSISDWKTDLNIKLKNTQIFGDKKGIKVHSGFLNQYSNLRDKIHQAVIQNYQLPIYVTGHSLGGALAQICAVDLRLNFNRTLIVVTIGSPRVGNSKFVKKYNELIDSSSSYRIKNYGDPITILPMNCNYHHVHKSTCIKDSIIYNEKIKKGFMKRLCSCIATVQLDDVITNHSLDLYRNNISDMCKKENVINNIHEFEGRPRVFSV